MDENMMNDAPETVEQPEPTAAPDSIDGSNSATDDIPEDGLAIGEDGEVIYGDKFFDDIVDEGELAPEKPNTPEQGKLPDNVTDITQLREQPNFYTQDELKNTPVYQWEKDRIPADMKVTDVYDMVSPFLQTLIQQNMLFRQALSNIQSQNPPVGQANANTGRSDGLMSEDEMDDAAVKLACERLKIESRDFDPYEMKHHLALNKAYAEIQGQQANIRQRQMAEAQFQQDGQMLGQFMGQLQQQSDYAAFDTWLGGQLEKEGRTRSAIVDDLVENRNVRKTISDINRYYRMFKQTPRPAPKQPQKPYVPLVESAGNGGEGVRKTFDYKKLGTMTPDEQAKALVDMGFCD